MEREAKRLVINQPPSTCHLSSLPPVLSLPLLSPLFNLLPFFVTMLYSKSKCSPLLYAALSAAFGCSVVIPKHHFVACLMLLQCGSPDAIPSIEERLTLAGVKYNLVFLIHLKSGASASCRQPLNFLVSAAL